MNMQPTLPSAALSPVFRTNRLPRIAAAIAVVVCLLAGTRLQAQAVTVLQNGTRFAGTGASAFNGDFGSATSIALNQPSYIVFDSLGNQFIADTANNCVRRIDAVSGNITTLAGLKVSGQGDTCNTSTNASPTTAQGLLRPTGLAVDSANNIYIADTGHNCVRKQAVNVTGTANLTVASGTCTTTTTLSQTPQPSGLAIDSANNLYIAINDTEVLPVASNYQVLRHTSGAAATSLCTLAGNVSALVPTTCTGAEPAVVLNQPNGLALDFNSNLYVADTGNNCIRQVLGTASAGPTLTPIGKCANDGTGSATTALNSPFGIVFSVVQSIFITQPNNVIRYIPNTGSFLTLAGLPSGAAGTYASTQDGKSALNAPLSNPQGIASDALANFYVIDSGNNIARELSFNSTFPTTPVASQSASQAITYEINQAVNLSATAGTDYKITSNTCTGALTPATAGQPPNTCQIFVQFSPTRPGLRNSPLVVTDSVSKTTNTLGLQGTGTGSAGVFAPGTVNTVASALASPAAVAVDSAGNAYVLEKGTGATNADVRILAAGGGSSAFAVSSGTGLKTPTAIATDAAGDWFIADSTQGTISRFSPDGAINTSYITGLTAPSAIATDGFGNLYIAQQGTAHNVILAYASGPQRVIAGSGTVANANGVAAATSKLVTPAGLAVDVNGVLYIADPGAHRVYAIDRNGLIHFLAGNGTTTTTSAGVALGTGLITPSSVAVDAAADVYIADSAANQVYSVYATSASGTNIATILGTGTAGNTGDGGPSILGTVNGPLSVAVDASGQDYIVDGGNNSVRKITFPTPTINFGTIGVGTSSPAMQQFFGNLGTDPLNLQSALTTSDSHFTVDPSTTTCGTAVLPGAVCAIGYIFTPTAAIAYNATSTLASNSFNSPEIVNLTGNAKALAVPGLGFNPLTEVYGTNFTGTVTVTGNPAPTGSIAFTGPGGQTFCTLTSTTGFTGATTCTAPPPGLNVGSYQVTVSYSGDNNYAPTSSIVTLLVTPAPLTITANSFSRPYGAPNPTFTGVITGLAYNDNFTLAFATTAVATSPVGAYPITVTPTPAGTTLASNYTITTNAGVLNVTPATLTVTLNNATRAYATANPTFTYTGPTGAANNETFTVTPSTTATIASPVGTYPITATVTGATISNYTVVVNPGVLTVTAASPAAATPVVTCGSASRSYGAPNPTFTSTTTGTLNGDTFTVVCTSTATPTSPLGTYAVVPTISGPAVANYTTITPANGVLTVTQAATTTSVATSSPSVVTGTSLTFTATVSDLYTAAVGTPPGTVNFYDGTTLLGSGTLNGTGVATYTTTALAIGSHTINATYQMTTNFAASTGSVAEAVTAGSFTLGVGPPTQFIRGAGTTTYSVNVTSVNGFTGPVALTCAGLPADATCTFGTQTVTLTANTAFPTTMIITNTAADARLIRPAFGPEGFNQAIATAALLPMELSGIGVLLAAFTRRRKLDPRRIRLLLFVLCTLGVLGLAGCGCPNSTFKTYAVNVTATSVAGTAPAQGATVYLSVGLQ